MSTCACVCVNMGMRIIISLGVSRAWRSPSTHTHTHVRTHKHARACAFAEPGCLEHARARLYQLCALAMHSGGAQAERRGAMPDIRLFRNSHGHQPWQLARNMLGQGSVQASARGSVQESVGLCRQVPLDLCRQVPLDLCRQVPVCAREVRHATLRAWLASWSGCAQQPQPRPRCACAACKWGAPLLATAHKRNRTS